MMRPVLTWERTTDGVAGGRDGRLPPAPAARAAAVSAGGRSLPVLRDRLRRAVRPPLGPLSLTGSTGAVTTIEYESGALADLRRALDRLAPADHDYAHKARWGDGNGFSHVRSALLKTSIANLDNRARRREVVAVVVPA
jgi:hypothetical protein